MGHASTALRNLGVTPPKERAQPSVEDQAIAAEQRRQTRKARGTMSKKQRLKITAQPGPTLRVLGPDGQPLGPATPASTALAKAAPPMARMKKARPKKAGRSRRRGN